MHEIARSLFFDDFHVGQKFVSKSRKITETDIINFAGVSWDHNQLHTAAEYAAGTTYGKRIAHGLLGVVAHAGLSYQLTEDSILALLELNWKFHLPIHIGDTIYVEQTVRDLRDSATGNRGILTFEKEVKNQENEVVQTGTTTIMLARRRSEEVPIDGDKKNIRGRCGIDGRRYRPGLCPSRLSGDYAGCYR